MSNHPLFRFLFLLIVMGLVYFTVTSVLKSKLMCEYKGTKMMCNTANALTELDELQANYRKRALAGEDLKELQVEVNFEIARIKTKYRIK